MLSRQLDIPVYMTEGTRDNLPVDTSKIGDIRTFEAGENIVIDGMTISSFSVSHDAADPVSYTISGACGAKVGMAHDLGHAPHLVRERLSGSNALILESNYCPVMLQNGPYPPSVQQRIRGRHGHLSNGDSNSLLASLLHDGLRIVILAHISEKNNTGDHALNMARQVLRDHPAELHLALRDDPTPIFEVSPQ
jgi:phosphoribosyl 1,2-cyclic phosphodiesterase